jgi:hypothetical protein
MVGRANIHEHRITQPEDQMAFRTYPRPILTFSVFVLVLAANGCGGDKPISEIKRNGEDLLARGSAPLVGDSVPGDVILAGGDVRFSGSAVGDYLGAGGKQTIGGRIHGSLRAAGGEIDVTALVDRNATVVGGNVKLDSNAVVARNAYLAGGNVQVKGTVQGSLMMSGGSAMLNGLVGRDVEVAAGSFHLGPRAQIAGNLRLRVPEGKVRIDPAARVGGTVSVLPGRKKGMFRFLWMFGFIVAGAVAVALVPRFAGESAEILRKRPGRSALVGLASLILIPCAIVIAAVTIVGIPLALLASALYVVLVYLARVPIALWLGQQVPGGRSRTGREGALVNFLIGGLILLVVGFVPAVGGFIIALATILGLGTLLLRVQALRGRQPV